MAEVISLLQAILMALLLSLQPGSQTKVQPPTPATKSLPGPPRLISGGDTERAAYLSIELRKQLGLPDELVSAISCQQKKNACLIVFEHRIFVLPQEVVAYRLSTLPKIVKKEFNKEARIKLGVTTKNGEWEPLGDTLHHEGRQKTYILFFFWKDTDFRNEYSFQDS